MSCAAINTLIVTIMWTAIAMLVAGAISAIGTLIATNSTNATNKEIHEADNAFNAEQAQIANDRDLQNLVESPSKSMEGFAQAGVNPLLAITGGDFKLPKASSASAASPLAMESYSPMFQQLQQGFTGAITQTPQIENVKADTMLKQAQANRLAADTEGITLDNQFKQRTLDTRVEAEKAALSLNRAQEKEIYKMIDEREASIKKQLEEVKTEEAKRDLMETQKILNRATARKIVEILPYEKLLAEAQTETQKSIAALNMVEQAFKQQLVDQQYALAMVDQLRTAADKNLSGSELNRANEFCLRFQQAVRAGDFSKLEFPFKETWLGKLGIADMQIFNTLRVALSGLNGSINPLSLVQ